MRRPDGTLRTDRPTVTDVTGRGAVDGAWGFHAIDGLPDVRGDRPDPASGRGASCSPGAPTTTVPPD